MTTRENDLMLLRECKYIGIDGNDDHRQIFGLFTELIHAEKSSRFNNPCIYTRSKSAEWVKVCSI